MNNSLKSRVKMPENFFEKAVDLPLNCNDTTWSKGGAGYDNQGILTFVRL